MKTKAIKTASLVIIMDGILLFILKNTGAGKMITGVMTLVLLGYFLDNANNIINHNGHKFFKQEDGHFYSKEQAHRLIRLNPEISNTITEEKSKYKNIPLNIIEGGEEVFDNIITKFNR